MRLQFDRGTIVVTDPPRDLDLAEGQASSGMLASVRTGHPQASIPL